jgi:MFS family permease
MAHTTSEPDASGDEPDETSGLLKDVTSDKVTQSHFLDIWPVRFWWLFSGIMLAALMAFFDGTIMASIHPVITSHFHASNASSWLSTTFFLTSTVSQPLYGRISDVTGRRGPLLFALLAFLASTAWCAFAPSIVHLFIARAVCGVGAGGITTMTVILVGDLVKIEYRGIYRTLWLDWQIVPSYG